MTLTLRPNSKTSAGRGEAARSTMMNAADRPPIPEAFTNRVHKSPWRDVQFRIDTAGGATCGQALVPTLDLTPDP